MAKKKPFRGYITHWCKLHLTDELKKYNREHYGEEPGDYCIYGHKGGTKDVQPKLGNVWRTSWVIKHDENGMIETRNSRYQLIGPEIPR